MNFNKTRTLRRQKGFSLLELLLVAALIPVVSFVIYSNFSAGMRLWKATQQQSSAEDVQIFYQKASVDFEQAFKYSSIPFEGGSDSVVFANLINADPALGGDRGIGQTGYSFDSAHKQILRVIKNISQLDQDKDGEQKVMLRNVESLEISYFVFNPVDKNYKWAGEAEAKAKQLPAAVRFQMVIDDAGRRKSLTKTFLVPVGSV